MKKIFEFKFREKQGGKEQVDINKLLIIIFLFLAVLVLMTFLVFMLIWRIG